MVTKLSDQKILMCLALVFIAPVIFSKLFLNMHWYREGSTNLGDLLPAAMSYRTLKIENPAPHKWQVLYQVPDKCTSLCRQQLFVLHQTITALGKDQSRVAPVLVNNKLFDDKSTNAFYLRANSAVNKALTGRLFVVVDPLGKWVTSYPMVTNDQACIDQARHLLTDIRTLLKLSKVG
ncbi:hypothetical protein D5018_12960 [Parashewanella curva]|uniref:Transmembrane cytochrome oxidase associated protein n=1 Tax=Parashewanella curva TaxID=2338552 RepID=A0A3L8PVB0_9GAMM|nr:hypothetical protein [Parashewanella curva]RLV59254.1 hypothetical protein D5018_12960 [Parashewanella curva]